MLGQAFGITFMSTGGLSFTPEYQAVYDEFTTKPSNEVAIAQDTMVKALADGGVWSKLDRFFVFAGHTNDNGESLIDWKAPSTRSATIVNSPVFTAFEGFAGDGASNYIDSNYNPSTDATNYTLNDASVGLYSRTDVDELSYDCGARVSWLLYCSSSTDQIRYRLNCNTNSDSTADYGDSRGLYIVNRTNSSTQSVYRNGTLVKEDASKSTADVPTNDIWVMTYNNNGSPGTFSSKQFSMLFAGSSLTQSDVTILTNAFEAYMDSNSKGIIT